MNELGYSKSVEQILKKIESAFQDVPKPDLFIRGTCYCDECVEHNQTLADHTPDSITIAELGNPGWDPICFASNQAFLYYLPGLIQLAFGENYYIDQLTFHLNSPERLDCMSPRQNEALLEALWLMVDIKSKDLGEDFDLDQMETLLYAIESRI